MIAEIAVDVLHILPRELEARLDSWWEIREIIELRRLQVEEWEERNRKKPDLPETE